MGAVTDRLGFRVAPHERARIAYAARLSDLPVSEFVRDAANGRAEQVLEAHAATTFVSDAFFVEMTEALAATERPNDRLVAAAARLHDVVETS